MEPQDEGPRAVPPLDAGRQVEEVVLDVDAGNAAVVMALEKDPDESGRQRMIQALNALAQDPMFKRVLDSAQERVDEAFTRTGRKKKSAGSPFLESADRINTIKRDLEALESRVRESAAAEQKIRELIDVRDRADRDLRDAKTELARVEAGIEVTRLHSRCASQGQR